jgi:hypothetical protein
MKMANEQSWLRGTPSAIPKGKDWPSLCAQDGDKLEVNYCHTLGMRFYILHKAFTEKLTSAT